MLGLTGKYRLDAKLGGGGMAEVFVGSTVGAEGFSRKVAIKRVLPGYSENAQFAQMFIAEAQLSSQLQHPNIVSVLDFDRDEEQRLFLVMELVPGHDLDSLLRTGVLPVSVVIHIISEVLRGLGYAHQPTGGGAGLIHRDISPHNVLLSWEGAVKVSDFGIAKARSASSATASVFIKGKPAYMSPEQANGSPLDGRSDLFAVGIMLWELLVGHRLFVAEDTRGILARVLFAPIEPPSKFRAGIPADVERVVLRMLDRDLNRRYLSCEDALDDLVACDAAPRAGRDELISILGARYPDEAPVRARRNSMPSGGVRAPQVAVGSSPGTPASSYESGAPSQPALTPDGLASSPQVTPPRGSNLRATAIAHSAVPVPGSTPAPHVQFTPRPVTSPSVVALRNAPTRTMAAPSSEQRAVSAAVITGNGTTGPVAPTSRRLQWFFAIAAILVSAGGVLLTLSLVGGKANSGAPVSPADAATVATIFPDAVTAPLGTGTGVAPAPIDAAPPPPPPPPQAIDARPKPDAKTESESTRVDRALRYGSIVVSVDPWAMVSVDGDKAKQTPRTIRATVGRHSVVITNEDLNKRERLSVTVVEGKTATIERRWN